MSSSSEESAHGGGGAASQRKYKGIRRRKWGKWVSEIRVPGTSERLWLGSYASPEAAAVAHDVAFYCLRGDSSPQNFNFPLVLPAGARAGMSPRSVQKAASDAGLAIDARFVDSRRNENFGGNWKNLNEEREQSSWQQQMTSSNSSRKSDDFFDISVEDYL